MKVFSVLFLLLMLVSCSDGIKVKSFTWEELGEPQPHELEDQASYRKENIILQSGNSVIIETYMIAPMATKWKPEYDLDDDTLFYTEEARDPVKKLEKYKFTWVINTRKRDPKTIVFQHRY